MALKKGWAEEANSCKDREVQRQEKLTRQMDKTKGLYVSRNLNVRQMSWCFQLRWTVLSGRRVKRREVRQHTPAKFTLARREDLRRRTKKKNF